MSKLCYKRWDGTKVYFEVSGTDEGLYEIKICEEKPDMVTEFDNSSIRIVGDGVINIGGYRVNKNEFYSKVEDLKHDKTSGRMIPGNAIYINDLSNYVDAVEYYRYVSLIEHLRTIVVRYGCDREIRRKIRRVLDAQLKATYMSDTEYLKDTGKLLWNGEEKKSTGDGKKEEERDGKKKETKYEELDKLVQTNKLENLKKVIWEARKDLKAKLIDDQTIPEDMKTMFKRAMNIYLSGKNLCYYRGIGHVFYQDTPSIFRNDQLREEARWYREMKTEFYSELDELHYLDRLAMLRHYESPTRLLDVTSNPLVALYMAVTYIDSDIKQEDYGEVIVYFDEFSDSKAYDSSSVLVLAALAKLDYEEKELLREVIENVTKRIDKRVESQSDSESEEEEKKKDKEKLRELFNYCVHLNAEKLDHEYSFKEDEKEYVKRIWKRKLEKPSEMYCELLNASTGIEKEKAEGCYYAFVKAYVKLLRTVRRENSSFTNDIDVFMLMKAFHVRIGMTNDRIRAQAGSFIICGLDADYINTTMKSSRCSLIRRMFIRNKGGVYKQLNSLGINDKTMFPDMPHMSKYLTDQRASDKLTEF